MKSLLLISLALTVTSFGATQLQITNEAFEFVNHHEVEVSIPKLNKELKAKGLPGIPEVIVVNENPAPYAKLLGKRATAANIALNREIHFKSIKNQYGYGYIYQLTICYTGSITGVPALIKAMKGNFLNSEQGILAIAAGSKKVINDDAFHSREGLKERFQDEYSRNLTNINKWLNYKSTNNKALVMSDYGPQGDGTELEVNVIPPCEE